jgi:hypothetical protein
MATVRRWYIYLVSAVGLHAVTWATITLLRNLLIPQLRPSSTAIAFQIAVIVVGLPIFLAHWLWGQRLAEKAAEERGAPLRRLYLYGMMAAFLGPLLSNAFGLISTLLGGRPVMERRYYGLTSGGAAVYDLLALSVLAVLWFYHWRVAVGDAKALPEAGGAATVRRLYVLGFSAAGLTMTTLAISQLLRWIMLQIGRYAVVGRSPDAGLALEATRLIVGLPLWLVFWRWAQRLFDGPSQEERESALRKFYLYGAVFFGALSVVTSAASILAGGFRRVLLASQGRSESDIRIPLSIMAGTGALWAYHALVLRDDAEKAGEALRQAGVRRLYTYLIAGIGLAALLVGLSGDASVLLRSLDKGFGSGLREELSWFTAAIVAGLPVWLLSWRGAQGRAVEPGPAGAGERRSTMRKIYLYFFLFVATMTVLSSAVFIVFRLVSALLGDDGPSLNELGHSIAFSLIAVGVWLYHGAALRGDQKLFDREQVSGLEGLRVAVVDVAGGHFGGAMADALQGEMPELALESITLAPSGTEGAKSEHEIAAQLAQTGLIVGPWTIAVPGGAEGAVSPQISQAVASSPARKLLMPTPSEGWEWVGVDRWDAQTLVRQATYAVRQIAAGEEVKPARPLGAAAVIAIVIGALLLLLPLAFLLFFLIEEFFL